jgi:molecular chaperone DnaJ
VSADHYDVLGVSRGASPDEIKKAYRARARELHPDTNPDPTAEERFKEVARAYEVLSDPERRQRYDTYGADGPAGAGSDPFGGGGLGEIFDAFFGAAGGNPFGGGQRRGRPTGPPRGTDMEIALELTFEEAVFGTTKLVRLRVPVHCDACKATGAAPGTHPSRCAECQGTGQVSRVRQSLLGQMVTSAPCTRCGGMGEVIATPCPRCRGEGRVTEEITHDVRVVPGVDNGTTLRISGRGAAGPRGGPAGDLYVHLRVRAHERFGREGYDLIEELHLPLTTAALGAHLRYETLDGEEDLVIPSGTQSGKRFRLRGRGVPHVDGRGRGELIVVIAVDTPTELDDEQDRLLRQLAELRDEQVGPRDTGFLSRIRSAFR